MDIYGNKLVKARGCYALRCYILYLCHMSLCVDLGRGQNVKLRDFVRVSLYYRRGHSCFTVSLFKHIYNRKLIQVQGVL